MRGYYFFAPPGTPSYTSWHYFGSRNWHKGDGTPWPEFGELEHVKQKWRDGSFPLPQPPARVVGSPLCVGGDLESQTASEPPPTRLIAGVDARCWFPLNVAYIIGDGGARLDGSGQSEGVSGGFKLDGAADLSAGHAVEGAGGFKLDGAADLSRGRVILGAGGFKLDGAADLSRGRSILGAGGLKLDGAATTRVNHIVGSGGFKADGVAPTSGRRILGSGGFKADGVAPTSGRRIKGDGGIKLDGAATTAHHP